LKATLWRLFWPLTLMLFFDALPPGIRAQEPEARIGWYNGDWRSGLPGQANWYSSSGDFSRVYDDFVVPAGGWTVVGVFSINRMDFEGVTKAAWEIRKDMLPGKGGKKVASGVSPATQIRVPGLGPFPADALIGYRIQVGGLNVHLDPGRYWLSVAPVGKNAAWYVCGTQGANAVGDPKGTNGSSLVDRTDSRARFAGPMLQGSSGQFGRAGDFALGVLIDPSPPKK
jgi:hypothetical protein